MNFLVKRIFLNKTLHICGFILVILLFAYGNSFHNEFLLDDQIHLLETGEEYIGEISFVELMTSDLNGFYRPTAFFIYKAAAFLFGDNVMAYRVYAFLLYYLICVLFYFILIDLIKDRKIAALACCLFAVHPINQGLVNFVSMSNNSLYVLYMQISTLFFLKYIHYQKNRHYYLSLAFYFVSLFAHEIGFLLPLYLFFIVYHFTGISFKKFFKICLPYVFLFIFYLLIRFQIPQTRLPAHFFQLNLSFHEYLATSFHLISWYLSKLFFPTNILFIWDEPIVKNPSLIFNLIGLVISFFLIIFGLKRGRNNSVPFGLIFFVTGLIPVFLASYTYTRFSRTAIIEPHWFTFSLIGFFLILSYSLIFFKKIFSGKYLCGFLFLSLFLLTYITHQSNFAWKDHESYCHYWASQNFFNQTPRYYLAQSYISKHDGGLISENYQSCEEIAYLAAAYHILGDPRKTFDYYTLSLDKDSDCALSCFGMGLHFLDLQFCGLSHAFFKRASLLDSQYMHSYKKIRKNVSCPMSQEDFFVFADLKWTKFGDIFLEGIFD